MDKYYLYPATLFASDTSYEVTTVLGSCVAVCLWDNVKQIGGINHFMLPLWNGQGLATPKYGNIATEKLLQRMIELGCSKSSITAKIFGGGEIIDTQISSFNIGERNIQIAKETLAELNIPIIGLSVGGKLGRKIIYYTETGKVLHKFIEKTLGNS
jgi:chemotaxis protein CheD